MRARVCSCVCTRCRVGIAVYRLNNDINNNSSNNNNGSVSKIDRDVACSCVGVDSV